MFWLTIILAGIVDEYQRRAALHNIVPFPGDGPRWSGDGPERVSSQPGEVVQLSEPMVESSGPSSLADAVMPIFEATEKTEQDVQALLVALGFPRRYAIEASEQMSEDWANDDQDPAWRRWQDWQPAPREEGLVPFRVRQASEQIEGVLHQALISLEFPASYARQAAVDLAEGYAWGDALPRWETHSPRALERSQYEEWLRAKGYPAELAHELADDLAVDARVFSEVDLADYDTWGSLQVQVAAVLLDSGVDEDLAHRVANRIAHQGLLFRMETYHGAMVAPQGASERVIPGRKIAATRLGRQLEQIMIGHDLPLLFAESAAQKIARGWMLEGLG